MTGIAIRVEPAITAPQSVPRLTSENVLSQTGSVCLSSRVITTRASVNSFQAWMKPKTPVATRPGASSGNVIRKNAPNRRAAVDHGRLLQLDRHAGDEAAQRPDREGQHGGDVDQRQAQRRC